MGDDGTIVPKCIDPATGELKLDDDGFPVGMNFWAGMDGQVYVRGNIYATDGVFNGIVKAMDFQLPSGDSMVSILNSDKKIKSDWLDLMGINIKNDAGQTVMTIDQTGVKFGTGFSPVTYQYSVDGTSGWHYTMTANDKYRRESYDGGGTWADGYQFKGTDGRPGTDGNPKKYLESIQVTEITQSGVKSALIQGARIEGAEILGGEFKDLTGTSSLTLATQSGTSGQVFSDLIFQNSSQEIFKVTDDITDSTIWLYGVPIVTTNTYSGKAKLSDDVIVHATLA